MTILYFSVPTRRGELLNKETENHLDATAEEDEDECTHSENTVNSRDKQRKDAEFFMLIDTLEVIFMIDKGATINTLSVKFATKIKPVDVEQDPCETTQGLSKDHKEQKKVLSRVHCIQR